MELIQLSRDPDANSWVILLICLVAGLACYFALNEISQRRYKYHSSSKSNRSFGRRSNYEFSKRSRSADIAPPSAISDNIVALPTPNGNLNSDYVEQLRHVMAAPFRKKRVMNKSEFRVFRIVEEELRVVRGGHRILSQTCLGEILDSDDKAAFASINAKRVDILVIQPNGEPLAVFEYQGQGHYQNMAAARDAVKKEALRKAGVHYLEINEHHEPEEIRQMVRKVTR
ncbi:DUF2726 domain-containing protein [Mesorhizobium sp. GR13]|uniref:DUF2726 domain-containing protein n=1 Tax=Mesorhizobium sp. GR13 TaxID=2562308 RepID=UPI0010C04AA7|nr:DUF2726 domain-containing protein [Mesorhizobium sp. GR13]